MVRQIDAPESPRPAGFLRDEVVEYSIDATNAVFVALSSMEKSRHSMTVARDMTCPQETIKAGTLLNLHTMIHPASKGSTYG